MTTSEDERRYVEAILAHLAEDRGEPVRARQLARALGVSRGELGAFRRAYRALRDSGRLVLGTGRASILPGPSGEVIGRIERHEKGFAFVSPEEATVREDLFVPPGRTGGAMTGDRVAVRRLVERRGRGGRQAFEVVRVLERGLRTVVGTLERSAGVAFLLPDGTKMTSPVVVRDPPPGVASGTKVVVEVVDFPEAEGDVPAGVVVEVLGRSGELEVETLAVLRAYGLPEGFSEAALDEARRAAEGFSAEDVAGREDLTALTLVTIDPEDARDYDDGISVEALPDGTVVAGVHIADVSHFVRPGTALDAEAAERSTSVYFPRRVVPMLPEVLSNGVCSLQQGQLRLARSVLVTYDPAGRVLDRRVTRSVVRSTMRLTYEQAQQICDALTGGYPTEVVTLVGRLERLARSIEARRRAEGMLHLELPEVRLLLDAAGAVTGAEPESTDYSHTIVEMLMVEANEAVATLLEAARVPFVRRVHPEPDDESFAGLAAFVRACGQRFPKGRPEPADLQRIVDAAKGRPEGHAINLALLRTFARALYSVDAEGHYALASPAYCHFTSPIRRYPDLTVHRALDALGPRRRRRAAPPDDEAAAALEEVARHASARERIAESAERELRQVLVLRHLAGKCGQTFAGVVTGVADFGLFVQLPQFLVDGLVRLEALGDDWWQVDEARGRVRGETTGASFRLGDVVSVRLAAVDVAHRRLDLVLEGDAPRSKRLSSRSARGAGTGPRASRRGAASGARAGRTRSARSR